VAAAGNGLGGVEAVVAQRRVGGALFAVFEKGCTLNVMNDSGLKDVSRAFRTIATCGAILASAVSQRHAPQGEEDGCT